MSSPNKRKNADAPAGTKKAKEEEYPPLEYTNGLVGFVKAVFDRQKEPPKFTLAVSPKKFQEFIPQQEHETLLVPVLNQPAILEFLAPQDILSLWRTCKGTWIAARNIPAKKRWECIVTSLVRFFYISQEAFNRVQSEMQGGWRLNGVFVVRLLELCRHLVGVYGPYEPDPAHRAFLAESCCFYYWHEEHTFTVIDGGQLLNCELQVEGPAEEPLPVPTLERLQKRLQPLDDPELQDACDDDCILWGDVDRIVSQEDDGEDTGAQREWWQKNQEWMRQNANKAPNANYTRRIKHGCEPTIWLMYNYMTEMKYSLGVGPIGEQLLGGQRFFIGEGELRLWETNKFYLDTENNLELYNGGHILQGGVVDFLICFTGLMMGNSASVGALIWCFRRGLVPCTKQDIVNLIENDFKGTNWNWGGVEGTFLLETLDSEKFGPAKVIIDGA